MADSRSTEPARRRSELWDALNSLVIEGGGWVTSVPGLAVMRIEIRRESSLPAKLIKCGFEPRQAGSTTRISGGSFDQVDIIEITLPGR